MTVGPCGPQFEKSRENIFSQHSLKSFLKNGGIPTENWEPPDSSSNSLGGGGGRRCGMAAGAGLYWDGEGDGHGQSLAGM